MLEFINIDIEYKIEYNNEVFAINVLNVKIKIDIDNINIKVNIKAKIIENNHDLDLKNINNYTKLNEDFSKIIKSDIEAFIKLLQTNNLDVLGLQEKYYKKYNKDNKGLW